MDDVFAWLIGAIAAVVLGLPALGFVAYWLVALFKFGWGIASGL